jgi:hypothetical protein
MFDERTEQPPINVGNGEVAIDDQFRLGHSFPFSIL